MDYIDLFVAPIYLVVIYLVAFIIVSRNRENRLVRKYFMNALHVRILGSIVLGLIYFFYYKGGDTQAYYRDGIVIMDGLLNNPFAMIKVFFKYDYTDSDIIAYAYKFAYYNDPHAFFISKTVGVINLFTFGVYTVSAFFFAILSLSGSWALFITFCRIAPQLEKQNAIAVLFLPSIFFWGAGILKDTLTFSAMGWFVFAVYNLFFLNQSKLKNIIIIVFSSYIMYNIKEYILISIMPACIIWITMAKLKEVRNESLRMFLKPVLFALAALIGVGGSGVIVSEQSRYSINNVLETSASTAMYLRRVSNETNGSTYDLGDYDPSLVGVVKMILPAINVALYRPYPWEIRNVLMLFSSLESMFFLLATLLLLFRVSIFRIIALTIKNPFLICCLIFSLFFSFSVGVSSYNFGTLVRYKIPMLPFYTFLIFYVYEEGFLKPKRQWLEQKKRR